MSEKYLPVFFWPDGTVLNKAFRILRIIERVILPFKYCCLNFSHLKQWTNKIQLYSIKEYTELNSFPIQITFSPGSIRQFVEQFLFKYKLFPLQLELYRYLNWNIIQIAYSGALLFPLNLSSLNISVNCTHKIHARFKLQLKRKPLHASYKKE